MIVQWYGEKYPALGRCLYCPATDELTDEHIIPFALLPKGGDWFLPKSSCLKCADITKRFEGLVTGCMFGPFREQLGLKSRRKKTGRISVRHQRRGGVIADEDVEVFSFPKLCMGFSWPVPSIIVGSQPSNQFPGELVVKYNPTAMNEYAETKDLEAFRIGRVGPVHFARMLAKIAHAWAIAKYGFDTFDPLLPPLEGAACGREAQLYKGNRTPDPASVKTPIQ